MSKKDYIVRCSVAQLRGLKWVEERAKEIEQETKHKPKKADLINIVKNNYMFFIGKPNVPYGLTIKMYNDAYEEYENKYENKQHQDKKEKEEVELPTEDEVVDVKMSSDIAKKDTKTLFDKLERLLFQLIKYIKAEMNNENDGDEVNDDDAGDEYD